MDRVDQVQIVVVGQTTSGKTTFVNQVIENSGHSNVSSSSLMNFQVLLKRDGTWLGKNLQIKFYDTKELILNSSQKKLPFKGNDIMIIVFDISNMVSYEGVTNWISYFNSLEHKRTKKVLLANKTDLQPCISIATIQDLAETNDMKLYFSNNKGNTSRNVFDQIIIDYLGYLLREEIKRNIQDFNEANLSKSKFLSSILSSSKKIEPDLKQRMSRIMSNKIQTISKRFQEGKNQIIKDIQKKLQQCFLACYGKEIKYSKQFQANPNIQNTIQMLTLKMIEINNRLNDTTQEVIELNKKTNSCQNQINDLQEALTKIQKQRKTIQQQKNHILSQNEELNKKCQNLEKTIKELQTKNTQVEEKLKLKLTEFTTSVTVEADFISRIEEEKSLVELQLAQERENDLFKEGRILKSMLRQLPGFGCQAIRREIEAHQKRRVAGFTRVYEFDRSSADPPHRRLLGRRDLLFLFELGPGQARWWLCIYLPAVFEHRNSTTEGLLFRVRDGAIDVFGCAQHSAAVFWRFNNVVLSFGQSELYFNHHSGQLKTQSAQLGSFRRIAHLQGNNRNSQVQVQGQDNWQSIINMLSIQQQTSADLDRNFNRSLKLQKNSSIVNLQQSDFTFQICQIDFSNNY